MTEIKLILIVGLVNPGLYILSEKWGILTWLQLRVKQWAWPSHCQFCMMWRLAIIETAIWHFVVAGVSWQSLAIAPISLAAAVLSLTCLTLIYGRAQY